MSARVGFEQLGEVRRSREGQSRYFLKCDLLTRKCYAQAYKIAPGHPLATTALTKLYEKQKEWAKLCRFLETIVQETYNS